MSDDPKLTGRAREEIGRANIVYVSAASLWESLSRQGSVASNRSRRSSI
jgi:PIN domain nuclease of toxin-antitoxin system